MSRVTCRCGEVITVPADAGPERVACPKCGAKIRLRRRAAASLVGGPSESDDGFIRFLCPCGRRLKVRAEAGQQSGKCPDCGRMVPVPSSAGALGGAGGRRVDHDGKTAELDQADIARLQEWTTRHTGRSPDGGGGEDATPTGVPQIRVGSTPYPGAAAPSVASFEAGLRVCPRCGKPVHISATTCRECGASVPRR